MNELVNRTTPGVLSLSRRQIVVTLAGVMLALFLSALDQTIVSTAMPRIVADLGGFEHYTWLTTAYLVTSTVVLPITGRLTDMYGRKPFYIGGLIIFLLGSVASGLSQSMLQIIAARAFQGIGAGVIISNAFSVVGDLFPPAERGKYMGLVAGTFGISSVIGPALGGLITDNLSWHWVFYVNVPLGLAAIGLFAFHYPEVRPEHRRHIIDWSGVTALTAAVVTLMLALSWGGVEYSWLSWEIAALFLTSALATTVFLWVESRADEPIVPLWMFRGSIVSLSLLASFFIGFGMFGSIIFVPLLFQAVFGLSPTASGGFITPMMLGTVVGAIVSGQLLSRTGGHYRRHGIAGLALMGAGMLLLTRIHAGASESTALAYIIIVGLGLGITMPVYTISVQNSVPHEVLGAATSSVPFFRAIGGSIGLAIFGSVMTSRFSSALTDGLPSQVKEMLPPGELSSLLRDAQALVNPEVQASLAGMFSGLGQQGQVLYQQTLVALRQALTTALSEVFLLGFITIVLAFIANWFLKEIPLRRQHGPSRGGPGVPAAKPLAPDRES